LLYRNDPSAICGPKSKRDEIKEIKKRLDQYHSFKQNHVQIGHRERAIKGGWRHGITGIDNADSVNTSVFFQEQKRMKDSLMSEKNILNKTRLEGKYNLIFLIL
jgi:hypothetical protein